MTESSEIPARDLPHAERAAFEDLALPHLRAVYRLAIRLAGDVATAEDLTQDTYLKALLAFPSLRDYRRVRAWLFQILSRLVVDRHRSGGREVPIAESIDLDRFSLYDRVADEDPFPYSLGEARDQRDDLTRGGGRREIPHAVLQRFGSSVPHSGDLRPCALEWRGGCRGVLHA